ncbi:MAG: hypothetical protein GY796_24120 [Chloroflexi bacterium]|nr:hypothetical protein [Chloroflexota bacterium]
MTPVSEIFAALRWWLVLVVLGTAVTPLTFHLLKKLPDRGYAFTKMLGLLLVAYFFWILGSLNILGNNLGGILVGLLITVGLSVWAYQQDGTELRAWLRTNWRAILLTELIFFVIYIFWVWVRAQNPTITATEKPMDFAFLNAIGRSPQFPPLDPWLSGFAISYYYFGYLMNSVLARLANVAEPIAFNLSLAWLMAGTGVGAFGLVYNLIAANGERFRRTAAALGIIAAIAIPIAGNMEVILEAAHGSNIGSPQFWNWLDVRDLNTPPSPEQPPRYEGSFWWWWRSSRPINEYSLAGTPIEGLEPIVEFPGFSFILGDLHPHVMALPFALLSLAVAFAWWLRGGWGDEEWGETAWHLRFGLLVRKVGVPLWLLTALLLGGLSFLNTWDVLIHLFVVVGAFTLSQWRRFGWSSQIVSKTITMALLLVIPAIMLYLPFYLGFRSQAGPPFILPMLNRPTRLAHFLIIFGLPLGTISILLLILAVKQRFLHWKAGLLTAVSLLLALFLLAIFLGWIVAASAEGAYRVTDVANQLGITIPPRPQSTIVPGWGITAVLAILPAYLQARLLYPGLTLLLTAIISLSVMVLIDKVTVTNSRLGQGDTPSPHHPITPSPHHPVSSSSLPFVLLLIITAALLTLGPEFVYLRDNFGVRLNTIFKFYYQAWIMFGTAGLAGIFFLWRELSDGVQKVVPAIVTAAYVILFALSLLFPYYAIQSRAEEFRGPAEAEFRQPLTLNGLAQMQQFNPDEYAAILWLRDNVSGAPVIVESVGGQYSQYGRVSASTGLPTLLGWAGHEYQWRGSSTPEPGQREPLVQDIYTAPNWENSALPQRLDEYGVELIYVGRLENETYGVDGRVPDKFAERLEVAYQNGSVTIYRWAPDDR